MPNVLLCCRFAVHQQGEPQLWWVEQWANDTDMHSRSM